MKLSIPGFGDYDIEKLILDLNGTITLDGKIIDGVFERIKELSKSFSIFVATADTNRNAKDIVKGLNVRLFKIEKGKEKEQKFELLLKIGKDKTVAVGNGANDSLILREAAVGICVVGKEGAAKEAILSSDIVVFDIKDALDILLFPKRAIATLRR